MSGGVGYGPLGWVVTNWRLKLLALVLAIGLLSGVAFSENPPTFDTVAVRVEYRNLPQDLVITNPTTSLEVPVAGFRSDVQRYKQSTAGVTIDLRDARAGANQMYVAKPRLDLPGLTFRTATIPISLNIEPIETHKLDIEVRTTNRAAGIAVVPDKTYATCGNANDRCQVAVIGPTSVVDNLKAYVNYDVPITTAVTGSSPNQPVKFEERGEPIDLTKGPRTIPQISWAPEVVTALVTTQGGSQTKTVPVSVRALGTQACGYQISSVDVSPNMVTVNGPVDAVSRVSSVTMDPIVLSGLTTSQHLVKNVSSGSSNVTVDPQQVFVSVNVTQSFNCSAPTPAAGVLPAGPAATPTPAASPSPSPSATP
ncbi:MAG TPA: CdaR family protein [Candidatus Dormibacteraeota bacterium]|nr:CdaR family protein [Candidatus Dormibacteraeota bacterium]